MKPLVVIALLIVSASATSSLGCAQSAWTAESQKLGEFARAERSRRSQTPQSGKLFTSADFQPAPPPPPAAAPATPLTEEADTPKPAADPVKDLSNELATLQSQIQSLKDQKTALQNEFDAISSKLFSPVTDSSAQIDAQTKMADLTRRLADNLKDLTEAQSQLEKLPAGPPKK